MVGFKAAISRMTNAPPIGRYAPDTPAVRKAAERINLDGGSDGVRPDRDYDAVASQIQQFLAGGDTLNRRSLADAVWCLWSTTPALAEHPLERDLLLKQFRVANRPRLVRSLAASYLQSFRKDLPGLYEVAALLQDLALNARAPYNDLQARLNLFDPERGPEGCASEATSDNCSIPSYLREKGLGVQTANGGFANQSTRVALKLLETDQTLNGFERLKKAKIVALDSEGNLQFEGIRADFANAILLPFQRVNPEKAERDQMLEVLLEHVGDPRANGARWAPIPAAKAVALRWFTEQSLRQFLDIVDQVADRRMWRFRRAFWEAVYDKGLIDGAWVVFDDRGAREARSRYGRNTKFGRFSGGAQSGQAVLILQIGSSVVAEWSHNGRCHIWNDMADGPALHRARYSAYDLRATSSGNADGPRAFSQSHMSPETYSWQKKVARKLRSLTGVPLNQSDYKVSRYG